LFLAFFLNFIIIFLSLISQKNLVIFYKLSIYKTENIRNHIDKAYFVIYKIIFRHHGKEIKTVRKKREREREYNLFIHTIYWNIHCRY